MSRKYDPLKVFRGADPATYIRGMAANMLERGIAAQQRKERAAQLYQYEGTNYPTIQVEVTQLRADPPLWRMRTTHPLIAEHGHLEVIEQDRRHLVPELRIMAARILLRFSYAKTFEEAKEKVLRMRVEERGLIKLLDSENFHMERRR